MDGALGPNICMDRRLSPRFPSTARGLKSVSKPTSWSRFGTIIGLACVGVLDGRGPWAQYMYR